MHPTTNDDRRLLLAGLAGAAGLAALAHKAAAGPLNPPVGPVASTGKQLSDVEPRTPVQSLPSGGGATYLISQPGAYYLTGNINVANGTMAISIQAAGVTLDLNGFTLAGPATSSSAVGINVDTAATAVTLCNGRFENTRLNLRGRGLACNLSFAGAFGNAQVSVSSNGALWTIRDCDFTGVNASSPSIQVENTNTQFVIERCVFFNAAIGIDVSGNAHAIIRECAFYTASIAGIRFIAGAAGSVSGCTAVSCATGYINSASGLFYSNAAVACTTPYSGVANVSAAPATASPWMNVSM